MFHLTLQQLQVVDGATLTDATGQAGIHRNTIANWRASDDFQEALASAHYDRAVLYRDRAVEIGADLQLGGTEHSPHSLPSRVGKRFCFSWIPA